MGNFNAGSNRRSVALLIACLVAGVVPAVLTGTGPVAADPASDYAAAVAADNPVAYYRLGAADSGSQMS